MDSDDKPGKSMEQLMVDVLTRVEVRSRDMARRAELAIRIAIVALGIALATWWRVTQ